MTINAFTFDAFLLTNSLCESVETVQDATEGYHYVNDAVRLTSQTYSQIPYNHQETKQASQTLRKQGKLTDILEERSWLEMLYSFAAR